MTTFYVDPAGTDDADHGGSTGAGAWLTLDYALNNANGMIAKLTSAGHTLRVTPGTWTEGADRWQLGKEYAYLLTVECLTATTIQSTGASSGQNIVVNNACSNLKWSGPFTFLSNASCTKGAFLITHPTVSISFEGGCTFTGHGGAGDAGFAIVVPYNSGAVAVTHNASIFNGTSGDAAGLYVNMGTIYSTALSLTLTNCTANGLGATSGVTIQGDNIIFNHTGCKFNGVTTPIIIGAAGNDYDDSHHTITGAGSNFISICTGTGHCVQISQGTDGYTLDRGVMIGGTDCLVLKGALDCVVTNCVMKPTLGPSVLFKGAHGCSVTNCVVLCDNSTSGYAVANEDGASAFVNGLYGVNSFTDNVVGVWNSAVVFYVRTAATTGNKCGDYLAKGMTIDRNTYYVAAGSTFGTIDTTTGITNLPNARTAWASYDTPAKDTNDDYSSVLSSLIGPATGPDCTAGNILAGKVIAGVAGNMDITADNAFGTDYATTEPGDLFVGVLAGIKS